MARPVKCPRCEQSFDRDKVEWVKHSKRYYHKSCYDEWQNESRDYKRLISTICSLRGWRVPTGFVLKQIKSYHEENNFSYEGMRRTLLYQHKILQEPVPKDETIGVGYIEYKYYKAQNYFENLMETSKYNTSLNIENEIQVKKVNRNKFKKSKKEEPIDLEGLI